MADPEKDEETVLEPTAVYDPDEWRPYSEPKGGRRAR